MLTFAVVARPTGCEVAGQIAELLAGRSSRSSARSTPGAPWCSSSRRTRRSSARSATACRGGPRAPSSATASRSAPGRGDEHRQRRPGRAVADRRGAHRDAHRRLGGRRPGVAAARFLAQASARRPNTPAGSPVPDCTLPDHPEVFVVGDAMRSRACPASARCEAAGVYVRGRSGGASPASRRSGRSATATSATWPRSVAARHRQLPRPPSRGSWQPLVAARPPGPADGLPQSRRRGRLAGPGPSSAARATSGRSPSRRSAAATSTAVASGGSAAPALTHVPGRRRRKEHRHDLHQDHHRGRGDDGLPGGLADGLPGQARGRCTTPSPTACSAAERCTGGTPSTSSSGAAPPGSRSTTRSAASRTRPTWRRPSATRI